jgi:hypothetical protein
MPDTNHATTSITVGDITIPTEIRLLPIAKLQYYAENPRIFSILKELGKSPTQDEIERKLWEQNHTKDLFRDIKQNGGLLEEVIVRDDEVLEGNSRLCAFRHLFKNAKESGDADGMKKWELIRVKILPKDTTEKVVFAILGMLHIRGKAEWRPYEQASYLFRQSNAHRMTPGELATQIGHKEADVRNMIDAYKMMEKYKVTDPNRFSYYVEFAKSRKLEDTKEYLPKNLILEDKFSEWVNDEKIPRAEAVRELPTILKDKSARTQFLNGHVEFEEALDIAKEHHPDAASSFYSKLRKATEAMENAEVLRIKEEVAQDRQKKYLISKLAKTAKGFAKDVGIDV